MIICIIQVGPKITGMYPDPYKKYMEENHIKIGGDIKTET